MKAVLFDLDGTLLPLDVEGFPRVYLGALAARLAKRGYDPKAFVDGIWKGTAAMMKNDGAATNEEVFWNVFAQISSSLKKTDPLLQNANFGLTNRTNHDTMITIHRKDHHLYETFFPFHRIPFDPQHSPLWRCLQHP